MMHTDGFIGKELGNYRVVTKIASGGFASVFKGKHLILTERIVAIKILHTYLDLNEQGDKFLQEAQLLEKLKHPYILSILDVGLNEGFPYLVTEYASFGSLRDRLKQQAPNLLPLHESLTILKKIGQALQYAHQQNVVHRDLKPDNILFNARYEPLLADFGIATVLSTLNKNNVTVIGTPAYMAPEQFRGIISRESDQYALGCIAYELFTGHKPFTASNFAAFMFKHLTENPRTPTQLNPQLPVQIEQAILKSIAKEQGDRHTDISAFIAALYTPEISHTFVPSRIVATSVKSNNNPPDFKKLLIAASVDEKVSPQIHQDIPRYVRQAIITLDSAISDERREAIDSLIQTDDPAALEALVKALDHPIQDVREGAADALKNGRYRRPVAQEALAKALQHPGQRVRVNAAIALSYYDDPRALPCLIENLASDYSESAHRAVLGYGESAHRAVLIYGEQGIQFLLKAVDDERKDIRRAVILTLSGHLADLPRSYYSEVRNVQMIVVPIVSALLKALHDGDAELEPTVSAIEHAATLMLNGLEDSNVEIRRNSAWALSIALPGLLPVLDETRDGDLINNTDVFINQTAKPIIRKARKDQDEYVRNYATWTFNQIYFGEYRDFERVSLFKSIQEIFKIK